MAAAVATAPLPSQIFPVSSRERKRGLSLKRRYSEAMGEAEEVEGDERGAVECCWPTMWVHTYYSAAGLRGCRCPRELRLTSAAAWMSLHMHGDFREVHQCMNAWYFCVPRRTPSFVTNKNSFSWIKCARHAILMEGAPTRTYIVPLIEPSW